MGGRQDFLRWKPATWVAWEAAGLAYDASVGFADRIGFRAGTAHAYHPWLLSENREARLLEIPIVAMDSTLRGYMRLEPDEALAALRALWSAVASWEAFFIWFGTTPRCATLVTRGFMEICSYELAGSDAHDWKTQNDEAY